MLYLLNDNNYFEIIIKALSESLTLLNIPNKITNNIDYSSNNLYLICTTHLDYRLPKRYISYNFEQLTTDKIWPNNYYEKLKNAQQVWDYSLENIKILNLHNIQAIHIPLGYSKCMENRNNNIFEKDIDIFFTGCINNYRSNKLQKIMNVCNRRSNKIIITNNCWNNDLEILYNRSKIGLNLHFYQGKTILEVHRIIPMIANKILVISERSDDMWYDNIFKEIVDFVNEENFTQSIIKNLEYDNKIYQEKINYRYQYLVNNCNMKKFILRNINLLILK